MDKKLFRSLIWLITYTVLLILCILRFDELRGLILNILALFRPLFIGFAIAFILNRPCAFFRRLYQSLLGRGKASRAAAPLAVATSYLALILIIAGLVSFVLPQLVASMELFLSNLNSYMAQLQIWINELISHFDFNLLESPDLSALMSSLSNILKELFNSALTMISSTVPHLFSITSVVVSGIVTSVLALVFSIYMLAGGDRLLGQIRRVISAYFPRKIADTLFDVAALTSDTFTHFVSGQLIEACILGSLCFVGMSVLRLDYAPLISVIIAVSALIPVAGAYLGAILSALLLVMIDPIDAIVFLLFLVILQQLEGNIIYPRVVGTSIGLPAIWVLTAVTVGGGLFGFMGMLLSVPVTSVLYALLRRDVHRRLNKPSSSH